MNGAQTEGNGTEKRYLCVDVGGTEWKAAPVRGDGARLAPLRYVPAQAEQAAELLLERFAALFREMGCGRADGLRLAFPGPFDYDEGVCLLQGLEKYDRLYGVNLRRELSRRLDFPAEEIRFLNDADAFALGEMGFGEAKGAERSLFVCIGTGMGSAFGRNGRIAPPGTPGLPEGGRLYGVPYRDARADDFLSRRGLMALSRERLGEALDGKALAQRAQAGDAAALACWRVFGERVQEVLLPWVERFRPQTLCFGGQITRSGALFLPPMAEACRARGIRMYTTADTSLRALQGLTRI